MVSYHQVTDRGPIGERVGGRTSRKILKARQSQKFLIIHTQNPMVKLENINQFLQGSTFNIFSDKINIRIFINDPDKPQNILMSNAS